MSEGNPGSSKDPLNKEGTNSEMMDTDPPLQSNREAANALAKAIRLQRSETARADRSSTSRDTESEKKSKKRSSHSSSESSIESEDEESDNENIPIFGTLDNIMTQWGDEDGSVEQMNESNMALEEEKKEGDKPGEHPKEHESSTKDQEKGNIEKERSPSLFELDDILKKTGDDIYKERAGKLSRGVTSSDFQEIYKLPRELESALVKLVGTADVYNIYRNRPVFVGKTEEEIVHVAREVINSVPSLRTAVLGYIGLLIHENTNCFFSQKENSNFNINYAAIENGTIRLIHQCKGMLNNTANDQIALDILKWCCDLSSELSQNNNGRPSTTNCRTPEHFLSNFTTCPPIREMLKLMDLAIRRLLELNTDHCMSILFYSSRHGAHFNWIWLHIADTFPGKVVENIFTIGGRQFKAYVDTIQAKQKENAQPSLLNQLHQEYKIRFQSLSEVFNFLMRRNSLTLKNTVARMIEESFKSKYTESGCNDYNIVFFFKLVTISQDTLRFLIEQNLHLVTPHNFFRGMQQIQSLDKEIILQRKSYQEFGVQMIRELDNDSLAIVFKALTRLSLDPNIVDVKNHPNVKTSVPAIREGAFFAMCEIVNIIMVSIHSNEPIRSPDYDIVSCFAHGSDLQFVIETSLSTPNWAPNLIRYLHLVSVAYSINKAAEIACRYLLSCNEPSLLHVLCAYLNSVNIFYPGIMEVVYKDIFSVRETFLSERSVCNDLPARRFQRNLALITNLTTILEWDMKCDEGFIKNCEFYPRSQLGPLLCGILSIAISTCNEELLSKNYSNIHLLVTELNRLIKSITPPLSEQKNVYQHKNVILRGKYMYKISIQLAHLLTIVLLTVSKDSQNALVSFETFRSHIILFYQDYVNQLHLCGQNRRTGSAQLFFISFIASCLQSTKEVFGEEIDLNSWKDSSIEQMKIEEEDDNYSFLDALHLMDTHQKINRLAHSGIIGQGARHLKPAFITSDDQLIRGHVFLDAVRNICVTTSAFNDIINTKHLANYLVEVICQDSIASDMIFQDWELEKEIIGKYQFIQKVHKSWLLRGLLNIIAEIQPCLWICLPILKAHLADFLSSLISTTSRTVKLSEHLISMMDRWMVLARKGNIVPKKYEYFLDFLPHITVHEAFMLFLELWRYFHQRTITHTMVEHAIEAEKSNKGAGVAFFSKGAYEGDFSICRRIIQKHIVKLGHLFPHFGPNTRTIPS